MRVRFGLACARAEARSLPAVRGSGNSSLRLEEAATAESIDRLEIADARSCCKRGIEPRGLRDDISLYAFLLDADPGGCSLESLVERRLDLRAGPRADERASFIHELNERLRPEIDRGASRKLYEEIELPLAGVLARMERTGSASTRRNWRGCRI